MTFYPLEIFFSVCCFFLHINATASLPVVIQKHSWCLSSLLLLLLLFVVYVAKEKLVKVKMTVRSFHDHSDKKGIIEKGFRLSFISFCCCFSVLLLSSSSSSPMLDAIKTYGKCHYEYKENDRKEETHKELTRTIWDSVCFSFTFFAVTQYFHSIPTVFLYFPFYLFHFSSFFLFRTFIVTKEATMLAE